MIEDVIRDPEQVQLPIEELSSPLSAELLEYCEAELLGSDIIQTSETTSCSHACYEDNTFSNHLCLPPDTENINNFQDNTGNGNVNNTLITTPSTSNNISTNVAQNGNSNFVTLFGDSPVDEVDDISASIDFSTSPPFYVPPFSSSAQQEHQFDFSPAQPQIPLTDHIANGVISQYAPPSTNQAGAILRPALPPFIEDCLSSVPSYIPLSRPSPSCAFLGPNNCGTYSTIPGNLSGALCGDTSGMFMGSLLELQAPELDFRGDSAGIYYPNPNPQILINRGDIQGLNIESQKLISGPASSSPLATEVSSFEDSAYKVGKLSMEERKEKIHRYMKKRNERNFSKKIKYACRKTLADSRPRVRGRFAKNDELGEASRPSSSTHDDDEEDEQVAVKEEEVMDSTDIFTHISGLNSFKCNYPIQSWIGPASGY